MIIEALLNPLFAFVNLILTPLQSLSFVMDSSIFEFLFKILNVVCFILPIQQLMPIILFIIASMIFRITIRILKTIWDILPLL